MAHHLDRFENTERPAGWTEGEVREALHIKEAREIARRGGFDEAYKTLRAEGRLDREVERVKVLYGSRLASEKSFMEKSTWEALTIMELYHPETAEHCVETYRIARDKIERSLLGSGVKLEELFKEEHIPLEVFYRACLLHDIGKVDIPYEIIANTMDDHECACLLHQHRDDQPVHDALKRNGIGSLPADPDVLIHELALTGHRPMDIAPAELLFPTKTAEELAKRGFAVDTKTLAELIRPHEEYSGTTLNKLGLTREGDIAVRHHNYHDLPLKASGSAEGLKAHVDVAELLHLADVEQAMKAHRGYKIAASNVAAMAILVHEAQLGRIKNEDLVVVWVRDEMEHLYENSVALNAVLDNPTDRAHFEAVVTFLNNHHSAHLGTHTVPIASSPDLLH